MIFIKAYVDIENALTQTVETLILPVIFFEEQGDIMFDASFLKSDQKKMLYDAINPKLTDVEIEMFFIDDDSIPNFGPDYDFMIENNILKGRYLRKEWIEESRKRNA